MSKDALLRDVFYDVRRGFGSQAATLEAAREQDPTVTLADVKDFLARQELRQAKRTPARYNTWVPKAPREEFQIDLMDFGKKSAPRYGFVAVDIFTKKLAVVPIADKTTRLTTQALHVVIRKLGMPANIMVDLGGEFQSSFAAEVHKFDIGLLVSRGSTHFAERAIGTLRKMIGQRVTALKLSWERVVEPVVERYNETVHTSTGVTPDAAAKEEPAVTEQLREKFKAGKKLRMKYDNVGEGDTVKLRIKPGKYGEFKTGFKTWSAQVYTVEKVIPIGNQLAYRLEGRPTPVFRHDMLKVAGVERPPQELLERARLTVEPPRRRLRGKFTPPPPSVLV